uniref:ATP synthase F0 subunit 8 n=1 Tax=Euparatettix tridentatus TaxID=3068913 RepID=A0AA51YDW0_9ORTH|nr:ATP synthase F0 subunit 8 [Euparatettix tridentatus]WMV02050.1 ATP synthase F0 subunit 8 [Euparatettix tridentatus]
MPQMMNLMWLPLMIFFSMAMMMMIIIMFTMKKPNIKNKKNNLEKKTKNWMW